MNERAISTETEYGAVLSQQTGFERRMVVLLLVFSAVSADAAARSVLQLPSLLPPGHRTSWPYLRRHSFCYYHCDRLWINSATVLISIPAVDQPLPAGNTSET